MKKRLTAIAICFVLVFTMTIMSSAVSSKTIKRELSSGATATSSLSWFEPFPNTTETTGSGTATTSINRAQLCNVSVTISGTYVSGGNSIQSTYSMNDTQYYDNGAGGINAATASVIAPGYGYWSSLGSDHTAYYAGARDSWIMIK
ncbi:MAG TPA: hypothetical protein IAD01_02550 [Candidatus Faeciplasma gallinarum]|uniref:Uncharacterized protein n=1 Tax=Candidatus Faeciplasma gallinarum TaxID=2840799 RepID=A0A9D1EN57_9FIRM|nr:hypothetical protein [Candidatus Faeciplasma gallinarum]